MLTGVYAPIFNDYSDPERLIELAIAAEQAGYDGFYIWDHLAIDPSGALELADATVVLAAIAQATSTLKLGPMITPLARRRPWKVAKELATLDKLSHGRVVFGVGLGEPAEVEFGAFAEDATAKGRAERLDEGLDLVSQFMRGERVDHHGKHYNVDNVALRPQSLQQPRPQFWVAASLPARAGLRRAARWDGCFPIKVPDVIRGGTVTMTSWDKWWLSPEGIAEAASIVSEQRGDLDNYAMVATGSTLDDNAQSSAKKLASYAAAGANWWLEWVDEKPGTFDRTLELIKRGAPAPS